MPVYDFHCLKCGNDFSLTLFVREYEKQGKPGFRCPKCHSRRLEQSITPVTVTTSKKS